MKPPDQTILTILLNNFLNDCKNSHNLEGLLKCHTEASDRIFELFDCEIPKGESIEKWIK